jgi:hypothetical protein
MAVFIKYDESSETLRLMPHNYLIACNGKGRWICDNDGAIPCSLAVAVFKAIKMNHGIEFGKPELLVDFLNENIDVQAVYYRGKGAMVADGNYMDKSCPFEKGSKEFDWWTEGFKNFEFYQNGGI